MSVPGLELLASLDVAVCERAAEGRIELVGPAPEWWGDVVGGEDFDAERIAPGEPLTFLAHFLYDAESVWAEAGRRESSGPWVEELRGSPTYLEAEALTFQGRRLLLITNLGERGQERQVLLRTVRQRTLEHGEDLKKQDRLQAQLRIAKERAEALTQAKSSFLANMSHEIRTPLTGVLGLSGLLLEAEPRPDQSEYLRLIKSSGEALLDIINDILDLSKIEAGKVELDPEPVELDVLLADVLDTLAVRGHAKGIEVNYRLAPEVPRFVEADGLRLRQIIINLVGNSIKFTDKGGVDVSVDVLGGRDGRVELRVAVRDTGVGIAPEAQQRIFEAFSQADSTVVRTHGGTGLGLSISGRLVALMGGHLSLESELGAGSTFHFTVDLPVTDLVEAGERPRPDVLPTKVLLAENCETSLIAMTEIFQSWGADVETVETAAMAEPLVEAVSGTESRFDLVVLSSAAPALIDLSGPRRLGERFGGDGTRILLCLGSNQRGLVSKWVDLHYGPYIIKPAGTAKLAKALSAPDRPVHSGAPAVDDVGRGIRVLLAEDNAVNQLLVNAILSKHGYEVVTVGNGLEAVDALENDQFGLVLMDVQMPRMDGFEATRAIRSREAIMGGRVPIVALTGHAMTGDRERCLQAGMDRYASKPINVQELIQILTDLRPEDAQPRGDT